MYRLATNGKPSLRKKVKSGDFSDSKRSFARGSAAFGGEQRAFTADFRFINGRVGGAASGRAWPVGPGEGIDGEEAFKRLRQRAAGERKNVGKFVFSREAVDDLDLIGAILRRTTRKRGSCFRGR